MGLSGRKIKQRIPADPRNLAWADDAAKFGSSYLSKFGWDASKGLGVNGEGRTSHIKVSHKLDMLGIGAAHQMDPNGIAWKQNKDFENLLKRLNAQETTPAVEAASGIQGEIKEEERGESEGEDEKKEKKRKRKKDREGASEEQAKKKRKKSSEDADQGELKVEVVGEEAKVDGTPTEPAKPFVPRNRAHRARAIASKAIASKSAASIAEILGIAPTTPSTSASSGSGTPAGGKLTPLEDGTITLEKLSTSAKSVADYFKEKLLAKSGSKSGSGSVTPNAPVKEEEAPYEDAAPRGGLGSSRLKVEIPNSEESLDSQSQRIGLSKFSSLMSSTFLSATTPPATEELRKEEKKKRSKEEEEEEEGGSEDPLKEEKKKKKRSKEKEEDGSEDPLKEKKKKRSKEKEEYGSEDPPKEKKKKRSKEKEEDGSEDPPIEKKKNKNYKEDGSEDALSKEERRRLRKEEKKNRKESGGEDGSS